MTALTRSTRNFKFKVLAGEDTSEAVDLSSNAWGSVQFPTVIDGGNFRYWASVGNDFIGPLDVDGVALTALAVSAGSIYTLPQELFSCCAFKLNFDSVQAVDREFTVNLKG